MILTPWKLLAIALAGWVNRQQQDMIEYLREENRVLREKVGGKRLLLTDEQRRRLAVKGKALGRKLLAQVCRLFSPDTVLRWHRMLVARKYDGSHNRRGPRPKLREQLHEIVLRMAAENPSWGYGRIHGALEQLGIKASWQTVRRIMLEHGLLDDPDRGVRMAWADFLRAHWESIAAADFFTLEAWTPKGLTRFLVLFVIDLSTRRVEIAGIHPQPHGAWMEQVARNLTDAEEGFLRNAKYLIHDRDPLFTEAFQEILRSGGVKPLKMPKQSPNLNPHAERFVWSVKHECLNKMILFGERHVRYVIEQYAEHYNRERSHQGIDNEVPLPPDDPPPSDGQIVCRERLGGLLKYYRREAA
jgi:putative transposase